jgi:mono/diheme cytochrome c family protein
MGQAFYEDECAKCHGNEGLGNLKKDYPKLKDAGFTFKELKKSMHDPEATMPDFSDVPDSLIIELRSFINKL